MAPAGPARVVARVAAPCVRAALLVLLSSPVLARLFFHGHEDTDLIVSFAKPCPASVALATASAATGLLLTLAGDPLAPGASVCSLRFSPAPDFSGEADLVLDDGAGNATIVVAPSRDPPAATDDAFEVVAGAWALLPVLLNDADADADATPVCLDPGGSGSDAVRVRIVFPARTAPQAAVATKAGASARAPVALVTARTRDGGGLPAPCFVLGAGGDETQAPDADLAVCSMLISAASLRFASADGQAPSSLEELIVTILPEPQRQAQASVPPPRPHSVVYSLSSLPLGSSVVIRHDDGPKAGAGFVARAAGESLPPCKELRVASVADPTNGHAMAMPLPSAAVHLPVRPGLGSGGGWSGRVPVSPTHAFSAASSHVLPLVVAYHPDPDFLGRDSFMYDVADGVPGAGQRATGTVTVNVVAALSPRSDAAGGVVDAGTARTFNVAERAAAARAATAAAAEANAARLKRVLAEGPKRDPHALPRTSTPEAEAEANELWRRNLGALAESLEELKNAAKAGAAAEATADVVSELHGAPVLSSPAARVAADTAFMNALPAAGACATWKCLVQSFDGRHNSLQAPDNGAMMTPLRRLAPAAYTDGIDSPSGASRPSTRVISNALFAQANGEDVYSREGLSELAVHFGQFLTHDIDFSTPLADYKAEANFVIEVPADDPWFEGQSTMRFRRSGNQVGTGAGTGVPREQLNKITSWLDLNVIYGTLTQRNRALRTLAGGKLLHMVGLQQSSNNTCGGLANPQAASPHAIEDGSDAPSATTSEAPAAEGGVVRQNLVCFDAPATSPMSADTWSFCRPPRGRVEHLSLNVHHLPNLNLLGKARDSLFVSGDNRANVQPGLAAMHTLLAREHNAVAEEVQASLLEFLRPGATSNESDPSWHAARPHAPSFHEPAMRAFARPVLLALPGVSVPVPGLPYPAPPSFPAAFDGSPASLRAYDEAIFQTARAITRAKWQAVVWFEWLPLLLGPARFAALPRYNSSAAAAARHGRSGAGPVLDASATNEFATAAFRFGHSQIGATMRRVETASGCPIEAGALSLRDAYFTAARILAEGGVDPVIAGSLVGLAQEVDTKAVNEIRNLLFATHTQGFDLLAFNVQRGRDHGLPDYNRVRRSVGLPAVASFLEVAGGSGEVAQTLASLYASVDDIDLLVGGLAEPHVPGGSVGATFASIIEDVFLRIRDGDRFWFESVAEDSPQRPLLEAVATLDELRATRVADFIARTSGVLDGRFGLEVVSSVASSTDLDALAPRMRASRARIGTGLGDSLFVARPDVLRRLDAACEGAWSDDVAAADEGLALAREGGEARQGTRPQPVAEQRVRSGGDFEAYMEGPREAVGMEGAIR